jgi:hypothetical protein
MILSRRSRASVNARPERTNGAAMPTVSGCCALDRVLSTLGRILPVAMLARAPRPDRLRIRWRRGAATSADIKPFGIEPDIRVRIRDGVDVADIGAGQRLLSTRRPRPRRPNRGPSTPPSRPAPASAASSSPTSTVAAPSSATDGADVQITMPDGQGGLVRVDGNTIRLRRRPQAALRARRRLRRQGQDRRHRHAPHGAVHRGRDLQGTHRLVAPRRVRGPGRLLPLLRDARARPRPGRRGQSLRRRIHHRRPGLRRKHHTRGRPRPPHATPAALVLVEGGRTLRSYYSSTCGGKPNSATDVWPLRPRL